MFVSSPVALFAGVVFSALLMAAAFQDFRTRRIPNRLVAPLAVLGLLYSGLIPPSVSGALRGVEGLVTGLACWLPFYVFGWLGAGDVKLFAAAGAWLGPMRAVEGSLIAALLGAVLALFWMFRARGFRTAVETLGIATTLPSVLGEPSKEAARIKSLPYGVAMATGALCAAWLPGLLIS